MADVVISHSTEDRDKAEAMARRLSAAGLKVWMYRDILGQGGDRDEVAAKIKDATRVIALWSATGAQSKWVLQEAEAAARVHRLINIELQPGAIPRAFQAGLRIDLSAWSGQRADPVLDPVAEAIATIVDSGVKKTASQVAKESGGLFNALGVSKPAPAAKLDEPAKPAASAPEKKPDAKPNPAPAKAAMKKDAVAIKPQARKPAKSGGLSLGRAFALGLAGAVALGAAIKIAQHFIDAHPLTVAASAVSKNAGAAAQHRFYSEPPLAQAFAELQTGGSSISSVAFGSDEWLVALACADGAVRLFESQTSKPVQTWRGGKAALTGIALDAHAKLMAASSMDGSAYVWRLSDGFKQQVTPGARPLRALAFSPVAQLLATGGDEGVLDIRDPFGVGEPTRRTMPEAISSLAWRQDGAVVAVGLKSGIITFVDAKTGAAAGQVFGHSGGVNALEYAPKGDVLASAGVDGATKLWRAHDHMELAIIPSRPCAREEAGKDGVCPNLDIAFSPDGQTLAVSGQKGEVEGFKVKTGERLFLLRGHHQPVTGVAWSALGTRLASVDAKGEAVLWIAPKLR